MAVDIGTEAIDRTTEWGAGRTFINKDTPATVAGTITSIDIWAKAGYDITGLRVGSFYTTNGDTLKCRASQAIEGTITAGSKVTKAVSIAVEIGDYIGCFFSVGFIELSTSGFAGVWQKAGEYIDPDDEAEYTFYSGDAVSLGGYIQTAENEIINVPLADTINGTVLAPLIGLGATVAVPLASVINSIAFIPLSVGPIILDINLSIPIADTVDAAGLTPTFVSDKILGVSLGTIDIAGRAPFAISILEVSLSAPLATVEVTELAVLGVGELRILVIVPKLSRDLTISSTLSKSLVITPTMVRK